MTKIPVYRPGIYAVSLVCPCVFFLNDQNKVSPAAHAAELVQEGAPALLVGGAEEVEDPDTETDRVVIGGNSAGPRDLPCDPEVGSPFAFDDIEPHEAVRFGRIAAPDLEPGRADVGQGADAVRPARDRETHLQGWGGEPRLAHLSVRLPQRR